MFFAFSENSKIDPLFLDTVSNQGSSLIKNQMVIDATGDVDSIPGWHWVFLIVENESPHEQKKRGPIINLTRELRSSRQEQKFDFHYWIWVRLESIASCDYIKSFTSKSFDENGHQKRHYRVFNSIAIQVFASIADLVLGLC